MRSTHLITPLSLLALIACNSASPSADLAGVNAFNDAWAQATRAMDNTATLALWDDAGISLLPSTKPIIGKPAMSRYMDDVMKQLVGATMESFALRCYDIVVAAPNATEWCIAHQVVILPSGQRKFDGWGKMLVVLRRGDDNKWRLLREMWNPALPDSSLTASPGVTAPPASH